MSNEPASAPASAATSVSRALLLQEFGVLPRLVERPVPEPAPGHTLVRMKAATVAHLDLNVLDGQFGILPELPSVPGTQGSGVVLASATHPEGALVPGSAKAILAADLSKETVGGTVDVLIDTVGGAVLRDALALVRPRGRAALIGYTAGRELTLDLADFLLADVALLPVNMIHRGSEVAADVDRLLPDFASGALSLPYERYGMDELAEAVRRLRAGEVVGRAILDLG
ncbi:zinc-binding dehydrogenase [Streptomyces sp. NPDC102360]|uniref:zinc-binding dehydrogenase n=1 Tax=Streptomyces sp. NPDC102360 TaxID=3366160 RepID=UPI0038110F81